MTLRLILAIVAVILGAAVLLGAGSPLTLLAVGLVCAALAAVVV